MASDALEDLSGFTTVVTGASSGIGRAIALEFAVAGANVFVHTRGAKRAADETAERIVATGREARVALADLSDPTTHERLVNEAWSWRGGVDVWVNNAGVDLLTTEAKLWPYQRKLEALWRVDVAATISLSRAVGQRMMDAGGGAIINMGWDQAESGMAGDSGELFATAKGAVMAFSRSLALSLASKVRVNCLAPGWIKTAWGEAASEDWQRRAVKECQLGRWGTPEDVARAARFVASPAAGYLTGQMFSINGGFKPN